MNLVPNVRSGSYAEMGPRVSMDDEHICIDDLGAQLGFVFKCPIPSAFYAVFDGHGGPDAAAFVKRNPPTSVEKTHQHHMTAACLHLQKTIA